jgi:hypothetical protein
MVFKIAGDLNNSLGDPGVLLHELDLCLELLDAFHEVLVSVFYSN